MSDSKGLVFLHIPKTAGTTLRKIIERQYPRHLIFNVDGPLDRRRFYDLPEAARRRLRVVQGHVGYGIHTHLFVPVDYITMLRHPVELVTSMYYFFKKKRFPKVRPLVDGKSLLEFADQNVYIVRNLQTRFLSGVVPEVERSGELGARGDLDRSTLEIAKEHLTTRVAAFGLSERFDESLLLFAKRLAWRNVFYRRLNTTRERLSLRDVSRAIVAIIEKNNALDMELYDFAVRTFDARVARHEPAFTEAIRRFQRMNPLCGLINESYRRLRWDVPHRVSARVRGYLSMRTP
jgi:hypothetical protein